MSENMQSVIETISDEIVDGQQDLFTGQVVETAVEETVTVDEIVEEIAKTVFGTDTTVTAYKIANIINKTFEVTGTDKKIPTQMMYNYSSKGMIVKGSAGRKQYTLDETIAFVKKYVSRHI